MNKYIKMTIGIILGILLTGTTVYAANMIFSSTQITYDNSNNNLTSTDVKGAIDELYEKANNCQTIKNNKVYFEFGEPTTNSTTDYTTIGKNVFIAKSGDQKSVCIIRNSYLKCYDNNNWEIVKIHIMQDFDDVTCVNRNDYIICSASDFSCTADMEGYVSCADNSQASACNITKNGDATCETN